MHVQAGQKMRIDECKQQGELVSSFRAFSSYLVDCQAVESEQVVELEGHDQILPGRRRRIDRRGWQGRRRG